MLFTLYGEVNLLTPSSLFYICYFCTTATRWQPNCSWQIYQYQYYYS